MGLPMYREPQPDDSKPTRKPPTDSTATARSSIRRSRSNRHPLRNANSRDENRRINQLYMEELMGTVPRGSRSPRSEAIMRQAAARSANRERSQRLRSTTDQPLIDWDNEEFYEMYRRERRNQAANDASDSPRSHDEDDRHILNRMMFGSVPESNNDVPTVPLNAEAGLGDRRRSFSPEEQAWEILPATIPMDERLPSASSSFTSTAASEVSRAQSRSTNLSESTVPSSDSTGQIDFNRFITNSGAASDFYLGPFLSYGLDPDASQGEDCPPETAALHAQSRQARAGAQDPGQVASDRRERLLQDFRQHSEQTMERQLERSRAILDVVVQPSRSAASPVASTNARGEHLEQLIEALCQHRPVPDHLWDLAGVQRRNIPTRT